MSIFDFLKRSKKNSVKPIAEYETGQIEFVLPKNEPREYATSAILTPKSKGEINEVTQHIWTYAPDEYHEAYCPGPPCSSLESDFDELRKGIDIVFRQKRFNERRAILLELVEKSFVAYSSGNRKEGMHLIEQIQAMTGKMK